MHALTDPNGPLTGPFSVTGQVTILDGCDAQIQFGFRGSERFAVTLQAGGPDCYGGSGAFRLHRESANPADFTILTAHLLDASAPFVRGHAYDVLITSNDGNSVSVQIDGQLMIGSTALVPLDVNKNQKMLTTVGLKVWGGSARFDRVGLWRPGVGFDRVVGDDGKSLLSPRDENGRSCDGSDDQADFVTCAPLHHQRHGLDDCNNWIGEANSHGPFLVGLLAAYRHRGTLLSAAELARLRQAILATYDYLEELYREARGSGRFKHQEYGRGEMTSDVGKPWLTASGLYGEAAFAVDGADIDAGLAKTACRHAWHAASYLGDALTTGQKALFLHQIATCARRDPTLQLTRYVGLHEVTYTPDEVDAMAISAGTQFVQSFAAGLPDGVPGGVRDSGLNLPWLEGIAALRWAYPQQTASWDTSLNQIASTLLALLGSDGIGDGFHVVPQASGLDQAGNRANWTDLGAVPRSVHAIGNKNSDMSPYDGRDSYDTIFFATTAYDLVQLGRLTGRRELERLAAGHLGWTLGLNPGVPVDKAAGALVDDGTVWKSVAFIRGLAEPHARGFENWAGVAHVKPIEPGEDGGRHREVWLFAPLLNGFLSIVNGEPIWDGQWDYHSMGYNGWASR